MGVPKFFRWMADRYPAAVSGIIRNDPSTASTSFADNLYLDMNGIVHQCCPHSTGIATSSEDIMRKIFEEIDYLMELVKPTNLLYIAVDGVAPRAKLNQQRARRFRSSQDRAAAMSREHQSSNNAASNFDSNCITPGTEFMANLSVALKMFVEQRMKSHERWRHLTVYLNGSETPGEGEHKIISYIRDLRAGQVRGTDVQVHNADNCATAQNGNSHDNMYQHMAANLRHCILGADADMIMLALATHEPFFLVLRDVPENQRSKAQQRSNNRNGRSSRNRAMQFIRIHVLREYICRELLHDLPPGSFDRERIIDDFVFLTFLVGNDFLPSLPAINIGDAAFDVIFDAYKTVLAAEGGYLVDHGMLSVDHLELVFALIGVTELGMYHEQQLAEKLRREQREARAAAKRAAAPEAERAAVRAVDEVSANTQSQDVKGLTTANEPNLTEERPPLGTSAAYDREQESKAAYYRMKFDIDLGADTGQKALRNVIYSYLQGLQWCLLYYSTGCSSWSWFYPYHYGPFLHDMVNLEDLIRNSTESLVTAGAESKETASAHQNIAQFTLDAPLLPFQQLLACLPASSCGLLPQPYHWLMVNNNSPLSSFYPSSFSTDLNGKKQDYEAVVLLPFIDKDRLLEAEIIHCPPRQLTAEERARNTVGPTRRFQLTRRSLAATTINSSPITIVQDGGDEENVVIIAGIIHKLTVESIDPNITPGQCFAAVLLPGTRNSIPEKGFDLPERVIDDTVSYQAFRNQSTRGRSCSGDGISSPGQSWGKGKKKSRQRANFYTTQSPVTSPGGLLMPGVPSTALTTRQLTAPPAYSSAGATETSCSSDYIMNIEIRLLLDDISTRFLDALVNQLQSRAPGFHVQSDASESLFVSFRMEKFVGATQVAAYESLLTEEVLPKVATVFSPITCALIPRATIGVDGTVYIRYEDTSHLQQIEQFIGQRLLGSSAFDDSMLLNMFFRGVALGQYSGADSDKFQAWFHSQLQQIARSLPSFTCTVMRMVVDDEDGNERASQYILAG